ncbi:MAG TPA: antitoxin [Tepidisphaeraceae bacterium]|nr:antitoxin [Tepidisphaeraceae bacterium]
MRNRVTLVLAGSLGAVGLALTGCDDKKDDRPVGDKVENAVEKSGEKVGQAVEKTGDAISRGAQKAAPAIGDAVDKTADSAKRVGAKLRDAVDATALESGDIMNLLGSTVDAVISKDGRAVLPTYLSEADRARIGDLPQDPDLEQHLAKIRDLWTKKFNGIFNLRDPQTVFKDARITTATQNDRKMAQVTIPAKNDLGALTLNFASEGRVLDTWKLDIPDTMTKADLQAALARQIKKVEETAPNWPNDPYAAYRMVAQQILETFSTPVVARAN